MQVAGWTVAGRIGGDGIGPLYLAEDASGHRVVLRALDSRRLAAAGALERVRDLVQALGALPPLAGIARILDLVEADGTWYLVTEPLPGPPLAALLDAPAHAARLGAWAGDASSAAAVLLDAGAACLALHGAGLAHGALAADAVDLDAEARARLREPGLVAALDGTAPDHPADARAFGGLVRRVRMVWVPAGDPSGDALDRAAQLAAPEPGAPDLDRAVDVIRRAAGDLPAGWEQRPRLRRAVVAWMSTEPPPVPPAEHATRATAGPAATLIEGPSPTPPAPGATVVDPAPTGAASPAPPSAAPSSVPRYRLGGAPPMEAPQPPPPVPVSGPVRIGAPPVAVATAAATAGTAAQPAWPEVRRRRRGRRLLKAFGIVAAAAIIALVLAILLQGHAGDAGLRVLGARVSTATPQLGCGEQAVVAGVVTTNGAEGSVEYEWSRSDGVPTDGPHTQAVAAGATSVPVSFSLTVTGRGELSEDISLTIRLPVRLGPYSATIVYRCPAR